MRTMAFEKVESVLLIVHAVVAPSEADWDALVERTVKRDFQGQLVWTPGGAPTSKQRMRMRDALGGDNAPVALLTADTLTRGVLALMSVFFKHLRAFPPTQAQEALDYLSTPSAERPAVLTALSRLRQELAV